MLINQLIRKEMREQIDKENRIYTNLVNKTNKIRNKYVEASTGRQQTDEKATYAEGILLLLIYICLSLHVIPEK